MSRKDEIAKEMSELMPIFLMHMFPYVFQPIEAPPSQVLALVCIQQRKKCSLTDLKNDMNVSAPTITGIVDRLERDGFVNRIPDEDDRRVTNVEITAAGKGIVMQLRSNIQKRWGYILSKLPEEQGEIIISMVKNITKGFLDGTI